MGSWVFFCAHDPVATRGQYLALSKACGWSCAVCVLRYFSWPAGGTAAVTTTWLTSSWEAGQQGTCVQEDQLVTRRWSRRRRAAASQRPATASRPRRCPTASTRKPRRRRRRPRGPCTARNRRRCRRRPVPRTRTTATPRPDTASWWSTWTTTGAAVQLNPITVPSPRPPAPVQVQHVRKRDIFYLLIRSENFFENVESRNIVASIKDTNLYHCTINCFRITGAHALRLISQTGKRVWRCPL